MPRAIGKPINGVRKAVIQHRSIWFQFAYDFHRLVFCYTAKPEKKRKKENSLSITKMNATQRLTVRSGNGAFHVVAIRQGLAQCTDSIGAISAHVDAQRGEKCLAMDVVDMCEFLLHRIAAALSQSPLPITATVEPCRYGQPNAEYEPA